MPQKITAEFDKRDRGGRTRGPEQVEIDNDVQEALGTPSKTLTYVVSPDEYDDTAKRVRSATRLHDVTGVQGREKAGPKKGTLILQFRFQDRIRRPRKPKTE